MKSIILFITIFSINILASQLNLSGGDVATIRANTDTTVTCGGSAPVSGPIIRCDFGFSDSSCAKTFIGAPCGSGKICISDGMGAQSDTVDCSCVER